MPLPIGQGHLLFFEAEAVGLEPTTGISPAPAFEAGSSSSRMTSNLQSSCGGRTRTCIRLLNREPPYHWATPQFMSVSVAGFEPTISCARGTRISRLSHTLMIARGPPQTTHCTQRESNPHIRPGETVRCRYVIGAFVLAELSKSKSHVARTTFLCRTFVIADEKAPGGTRTHVAALRVRCLGR